MKNSVDSLRESFTLEPQLKKSMLIHTPPKHPEKIPGYWETNNSPFLLGCKRAPETRMVLPYVYITDYFLASHSCDVINDMMVASPIHPAPVSVQGMSDGTGSEEIGSHRITMFNTNLAKELERLFNVCLDSARDINTGNYFASDWYQLGAHNRWQFVGVSPMLRWMKYCKASRHAAHYDAGFIYDKGEYRTLFSFVLYLSTNKTGATRIIKDGQENIPVWGRDHSDWDRDVKDSEVLVKSAPVKGSVLYFPHRMCHDVELYDGAEGDRIIIRGDLVYRKA